jgi:hypothetical protein
MAIVSAARLPLSNSMVKTSSPAGISSRYSFGMVSVLWLSTLSLTL